MISKRASRHAHRMQYGAIPGRRVNPHQLPNFGAAGQGPGYTGIQGILAALQGGVSADQYNRMDAGHTGGNGWGSIGGMGGALSGLSPYAVHYLTQNLLEKKAAQHQDVNGLEGDALWKATLMNNLSDQNAEANPSYQLHAGVDSDFLTQLFGAGFGGHGAYEHGYGAGGANAPRFRPFRPGRNHKGPRPIIRRQGPGMPGRNPWFGNQVLPPRSISPSPTGAV